MRAEATLADRQGTMVPAIIAPCERPIIFELTQTADLSGWDGDAKSADFAAFLADLRSHLGAAPSAITTTGHPEPRLDQIMLVVLPFTNMSRDDDQQFFADGITEDVITDLSKVSALKVIARNTAFSFKGQHADLGEVARKLNVSHIVEGSVRRAGNRVRVSAQLVDATDGSHIWAERWDRDLEDIFDLQDELSQEIVRALKVRLLPAERRAITSRGTASVAAYDCYLRAHYLDTQMSPEPLTRAASLMHEAIEIDPHYVQAYGYLTEVLGNSSTIMPHRSAEFVAEIRELEQRASAIDPGHVWVRAIRAALLARDKDWLGVFGEIEHLPYTFQERPIWMQPWYFDFLIGRFESGIEDAREMMRLNPLDFLASLTLQSALDCAGRHMEAQIEAERSKDIPGNTGWVDYLAFLRSKSLHADSAKSSELYARFMQTRGPEMRMALFDALAPLLDQPDAALKVIADAIDSPEYRQSTPQVWLAMIAGYFGGTELALKGMRNGYVEHRPHASVHVYFWHPTLREARRDPRCKEIVREAGFARYWRETGRWSEFVRPVGDTEFEIIA